MCKCVAGKGGGRARGSLWGSGVRQVQVGRLISNDLKNLKYIFAFLGVDFALWRESYFLTTYWSESTLSL